MVLLPEHHAQNGKPRPGRALTFFAAVLLFVLPAMALVSLSGVVWSRHIVPNAADTVASQRSSMSAAAAAGCQPVSRLIPPPKTRQDIAVMLQHEGFETGALLGVQDTGVFAAEMLWVWRSCKRLYLVDDFAEQDHVGQQQQHAGQQQQLAGQQQHAMGRPATPLRGPGGVVGGPQQPHQQQQPASQAEIMQQAHENLQQWQHKAVWMRNSTSVAAALIAEPLDFVYLDAHRTHCEVLEDLKAWFPLVRPGGVIAGHSYENAVDVARQTGQDWSRCPHTGAVHQGAVQAAVNEFFAEQGLQIVVTYREQRFNSWLVRKPEYPCSSRQATSQHQDEQLTQLLSQMLQNGGPQLQQQQSQPKQQQQQPQERRQQPEVLRRAGVDTDKGATPTPSSAVEHQQPQHKERLDRHQHQQQQLSAALQKLHAGQGMAAVSRARDAADNDAAEGPGSRRRGAEVFGDILSPASD